MDVAGSVLICELGGDERAADRLERLARGFGQPFGVVLDLDQAGPAQAEQLATILALLLGRLPSFGLRGVAILASAEAAAGATRLIEQAGAGAFVRLCDSRASAFAYLESHGLSAAEPPVRSDT